MLSIDEMAEKRLPHCVLLTWQGGKFTDLQQQGWLLADLAPLRGPGDDTVLFVGSHGLFVEKSPAGAVAGNFNGGAIAIGDHGPLRAARHIDGAVYLVGGDRQAYRVEADRTLRNLDSERVLSAASDSTVGSLEDIDGFGADEVYAVGFRGEIWRYDGRGWASVPSPTRLLLNAVCCAGNGTAYACGLRGTLVQGRGAAWESIELNLDVPQDLFDLCWFQGRLYLASLHTVFVLDNGSARPVNTGATTSGKLSTDGQVLWSIGAKHVMAFDGQQWQRID